VSLESKKLARETSKIVVFIITMGRFGEAKEKEVFEAINSDLSTCRCVCEMFE
jgi:hypothetical protein